MISLILTTAVCSMVGYWAYNAVYSIFFSPLRKIPGPLLFQLLPIVYDYYVAKGSPYLMDYYHAKYGPIFRLGWNRVVVVDARAVNVVYGSYKFKKSVFYNLFYFFGNNVFSIRDKASHMKRKKLLMPAFAKNKVIAMEPTIMSHGVIPLLDNMDRALSLPDNTIDLFHQFHYMGWDIIGALAFGESFDMLRDGDHPAVGWLENVLSYSMLTYALPLLKSIPSPSGINLRKFAEEMMDRYYLKRQTYIDQDKEIPDTLIENFVSSVDQETGEKLTREDILSEALLMLFAGTDTSSNSLSFFFYLLMKNEGAMTKVQREISGLGVPRDQLINYEQCKDGLPYLEAAFKESMRLLPVVPGGLLRETPDEGATILGHHLPQGTTVSVPILATQRSPLIWENPDDFLPERWFDKEMDTRAFYPFQLGPRGCIGRELAWLEMLVVSANILNRFQLELVHPDVDLEMVAKPVLRPKGSKILARVKSAPI